MKALSRLLKLKAQIQEMSMEIDIIMPDAIAEALEIHESQAKGNIVIRNELGKVVLQMRKRINTENTTLVRIDSDIKDRTAQLAQKHAAELSRISREIEELQKAIAQLEAERNSLLSDRYISRLKKEYAIEEEQAAYLQPILSVFVK